MKQKMLKFDFAKVQRIVDAHESSFYPGLVEKENAMEIAKEMDDEEAANIINTLMILLYWSGMQDAAEQILGKNTKVLFEDISFKNSQKTA